MKISLYKKGDEKEIKEFISRILEEIFHSPASGLDDLNDISKNFELFLIATDKGKIIGTIGVKKEDGCARVSRMYISANERGKGLGKILMKRALEYCKGRFRRVFLTTYEQMNSAGFYEKIGFRVFKKERDVIWMEMLF